MAVVANKRSVMTLFSSPTSVQSHRARIVLAEKGITFEITNIASDDFPEDLMDLNPYGSVPTLVDRDLVLYYARVIIEYLDERFPHPPLMPVDPVSRARARLALTRVEREWYPLAERITQAKSGKDADAARNELRDSLSATADVFAAKPFFLSEDFALVDCTILPILWRLPQLGVQLPPQATGVLDYADRLFERDSFRSSLSEPEREMRN